MRDFFVSYNKADSQWAEWIAWKLEETGFDVVIQAWDFRPGENFVFKMQDALKNTKKMVLVFSEDYLNSSFTAAEWTSVFATDPVAKERKLVPIRVRECTPEGLLGPLIYVDLVNLSEPDAEGALLGAFADRSKPSKPPGFPGGSDATLAPSRFPGKSQVESRIAKAQSRVPEADLISPEVPVPIFERIRLNTELNAITPSQFNMLLTALSPPPGLVPTMPALQADRSSALLAWAISPAGLDLRIVEKVLRQIANPR
jgi:hypothetical protein